jgi:hypothetical protein
LAKLRKQQQEFKQRLGTSARMVEQLALAKTKTAEELQAQQTRTEAISRCSTSIRHTHHIHHILLVVQYILQYSITIQYTHTLSPGHTRRQPERRRLTARLYVYKRRKQRS